MNCNRCKTKIAGHLWITEGGVYCSPRCERWTPKGAKPHRYSDRVVEKIGVAGTVN